MRRCSIYHTHHTYLWVEQNVLVVGPMSPCGIRGRQLALRQQVLVVTRRAVYNALSQRSERGVVARLVVEAAFS